LGARKEKAQMTSETSQIENREELGYLCKTPQKSFRAFFLSNEGDGRSVSPLLLSTSLIQRSLNRG
jgi:hypothetical protein